MSAFVLYPPSLATACHSNARPVKPYGIIARQVNAKDISIVKARKIGEDLL